MIFIAGLKTIDQIELSTILMGHGVKKIILHGSRVKGNYIPTSDVDIIILEPSPFPFGNFAQMKLDLEESNIPVKIDIQRSENVTQKFMELIRGQSERWNIKEGNWFKSGEQL